MASWSIFEPAAAAPDSLEAADGSVFVRDGFSLVAFLVAPLWLLWRRMWLVFLFWLAAQVALSGIALALGLGGSVAFLLSLLFAYGFALEANNLRHWTMSGKGWRFAGIACGQDQAEAEYRHFEGRSLSPSAPPPSVPPHPGPAAYGAGHGAVLGVFPEPWGTRS